MPDQKTPEITPEMIEAGAIELAKFDGYFTMLEDGARRIYLAMWAAKTSFE